MSGSGRAHPVLLVQPLKRCRQRSSSASIVMGDSVDLECFLLGSGGVDSSVGDWEGSLCLVCRGALAAACDNTVLTDRWCLPLFFCVGARLQVGGWCARVALCWHCSSSVVCFLVRGDKKAAMVPPSELEISVAIAMIMWRKFRSQIDKRSGVPQIRATLPPAVPGLLLLGEPCSVPILRRWILLLRALPSLPLLLPSSLSLARPRLEVGCHSLAGGRREARHGQGHCCVGPRC